MLRKDPLFTVGRRALALLCLVLAGLALYARSGPPLAAQAEATVRYRAGWNLIAAPSGNTLAKASGPAYALGPHSDGYQVVGPGELIGGRAVWVFFPEDTTVTLGKTAAEYSRTLAPANEYLLLGDPSATATLTLSGADTAFAYDPAEGYKAVSELAPGQGAFVLSEGGSAITLGKPPAGAQADEIVRLQRALTDSPTDRANIDRLGAVAADLVKNRQYTDVQAVLDDLRAATEDGLRRAGSGPLPPLSQLQQDSVVVVREAVARAKAAATAGDLTQADAAIEAARRAAQAAEDDGISRAEGGDSGRNARYAAAGRAQQAAGLAAFGALVRAAFFATGLGQPPADPFWNLATSVLTNTAPVGPIPPRPVATPPPAAPCASGCSFSADGRSTFTLNAAPVTYTTTFTFQLTVANGTASGQGQFSDTIDFPLLQGAGCNFSPVTGQLTVTGTFDGQTLHLTLQPGQVARALSCSQGAVPEPFAGDSSLIVFGPVELPARDGGTGSAGPTGQFAGVGSGSLTVTVHGGR